MSRASNNNKSPSVQARFLPISMAMFFAFVWMSLVSCGEPHAGRPGGDETPNQISAHVLDSLGRGVSGALVRARPVDWTWGEPLGVDSTTLEGITNEQGGFSLQVGPGLWRIEIRKQNQAAQWILQSGSQVVLRESLLPVGQLQGRAEPHERLGVVGMAHWTSADSLGAYTFDGLPWGLIQVRSLNNGSRIFAQVSASQVSLASTLYHDDRDTILIEDFEDGDSQHRLGPVVGGGWWYAIAKEGMVTRPLEITDSLVKGLEWDSVLSSTVLHYEADVDTNTWPWSEVGVGLASSAATDMGLAQNIAFKIRGQGNVCLHLTSTALGPLQEIFWCFDLSDVWTEMFVPIDSLQLYGAGVDTLDRRDVLAKATQIRWNCKTDLRIWLDQVRITGIEPESLWNPFNYP